MNGTGRKVPPGENRIFAMNQWFTIALSPASRREMTPIVFGTVGLWSGCLDDPGLWGTSIGERRCGTFSPVRAWLRHCRLPS